MMTPAYKFPIGIQNFRDIRRNGYIYVDKTGYIRRLVDTGKYYFLSRPRRFGKSLLMSTIEAYFKGCKELFEGLEIASYEKEWKEYPVFHLDLSGENYNDIPTLTKVLNYFLSEIEKNYGLSEDGHTVALRFKNAIKGVYDKTGRQVVILVDEYDTPLTQTLTSPELQEEFRNILKGFYGVMKSMDGYIKLAMLTGVTRFSKVSIFSDLNNLRDISFLPEYNAICGVAESEIVRYFTPAISSFADKRNIPVSAMAEELRRNYDGYRFADPAECEGIYNPFSLLNALASESIGDYWFETGTPTFLVRLLQEKNYPLDRLNKAEASQDELKGLDLAMAGIIPLMYQSGYLTIRDFDRQFGLYALGFPNKEVERGFLNFLFPYYTSIHNGNGTFAIREFTRDISQGNVDSFMHRLQSLFADFPYDQIRDTELHFHNVLYLVFTLMGYYTRTEYRSSHGRADLIVKTDSRIFIFEFKLDKSPREAIEQIDRMGYALPFSSEGKEIIKIGVNFSSTLRNIDSWIVEKDD